MLRDEFPQAKKYYRTYQIRFSQEERQKLEKWANGRPIAAYIKDVLFVEERKPERTHGLIIEDRKLFGKALGFLGKSRLANNINQLAKAANSGSLPLDDETKAAILKSANSILWLRRTFMRAMGLKLPEAEEDKPYDPEG